MRLALSLSCLIYLTGLSLRRRPRFRPRPRPRSGFGSRGGDDRGVEQQHVHLSDSDDNDDGKYDRLSDDHDNDREG
jgi:hypothetical protein